MKNRLFDGVGGRGRRVTTISLLLGALIAGVGAWAFFSGSGQGLALATAATLDAPGNVSASATSGYTTVTVPWNATTLSTGLAVDGYYVTRTNVSSGVTSAACGTSAALLTASTSCTDTSVPDGTYTYAVVAVFRTWTATGTSNAVTISADTTLPSSALVFPTDGGRYRTGSWTGGCNVAPYNATDSICGTAQDSGANTTGVAQAQVSIQRASTAKYWDGSSFSSSGEVRLTASGTTTWTRAFPAGNFSADGTYTIRVYARDGAGNTSSATTADVLIDNTAPALVTVIGAATGTGPVGYVRQGGGYRVYANASDAGSGVDAGSLVADVSALTTGSTAVALSAGGCPCVVGGTSYGYRSGALTASSPVGEGSKSYTLAGADNVANSGSQSGSVTVDNTAPALTSVIGATSGTSPAGYVKQGGGYRVYANASDGGSGVNAGSLSADLSAITSGSSSVALSTSGCPCTVGGTSYSYQSSALTASNPLGEGAKSYTLSGADNLANTATPSATVTVDNTAPALTTVIADASTNAAGFLHQAGTYFVYANASDAGSGINTSSLTANVNSITTGATALGLTTSGGPWTIDGTSYAYRTAQQTAKNPLAAGSVTYSVTGADNLANSTSPSSSVTVDNTAPASSNTTLANGGTTGTADTGDTVTIVYSEKIASSTFCSTWTDNTVSHTLDVSDVVVTITNNASNDAVGVSGGATCTFHLGSIATGGNYVSSTATFAGSGASGAGTDSTLAWNPSTRTLTITLGKRQTGSVNTGVGNHTPAYTADGALKDLAGNPISTAAVNGTSSHL